MKLTLSLFPSLRRTRIVDEAGARSQWLEGIDFGEALLEEGRLAQPESMAYNLDGFDEMNELAELAGAIGQQEYCLPRIRAVRDDVIRARLLVFYARGLAHRSSQK